MTWRILAVSVFFFIATLAHGQTLEVEANDLLRFQPSELKLKSGEKVVLVFKNVGKIASLKHNFILLKKDVDVNQFGNKLMAEGSKSGLPSGLTGQVVVFSKMLGSGESDRLEFMVPEPGTYIFICGFPGHHSVSRGTCTVQ